MVRLALVLLCAACWSTLAAANECTTNLCRLVFNNARTFDIKNALGPGPLQKTGHDHITYRLVAAHALGANATSLDKQYMVEANGLEPALPSQGFISTGNWVQHIGEHVANTSLHYSDYLQFFRKELALRGLNTTLQMSWPRLSAGVAGDLFHALIQLSYAWEGNYGGTAMRLEVVAEGLAWLSTSFCEYAPLPLHGGRAGVDAQTILAQLSADESLPHFASTTPLVDRMTALTSHAADLADYDMDPQTITSSDVALVALRTFAAMNFSDFFVLHLLTSARALDTLGRSMRGLGLETSLMQARQRHWRAFVYWFSAYNRPVLQLPTAPPATFEQMPSWPALAKRAASVLPGDAHVVKLVLLASDFAARTSEPMWGLMALRVIERFERGDGWTGTGVFTAPVEPVVCSRTNINVYV